MHLIESINHQTIDSSRHNSQLPQCFTLKMKIANNHMETVAQMLLDTSECKWAGLGARDSLRLEAGMCLYGHDIDATTSPIEANLAWVICSYSTVFLFLPHVRSKGASERGRIFGQRAYFKRIGWWMFEEACWVGGGWSSSAWRCWDYKRGCRYWFVHPLLLTSRKCDERVSFTNVETEYRHGLYPPSTPQIQYTGGDARA